MTLAALRLFLFIYILKKFGLPKAERISLKKEIESLFDRKNEALKSFFAHPLKMIALPTDDSFSKIIITVPKRKFKKAVDRNLLKRRIREAYRTQKQEVASPHLIGFIYVGNEIENYEMLENAVLKILKKL